MRGIGEMRKWIAGLVMAAVVGVGVAFAGGWTETRSIAETGWTDFTNTQDNATWAPAVVAAFFRHADTCTVSIIRVSQGYTVPLATATTINNGTSAVWTTAIPYTFASGDILRVQTYYSTLGFRTNGVIQVTRRND